MNYCAVKRCLNAATRPIAFASVVSGVIRYEYHQICDRHSRVMRHELIGKTKKG